MFCLFTAMDVTVKKILQTYQMTKNYSIYFLIFSMSEAAAARGRVSLVRSLSSPLA